MRDASGGMAKVIAGFFRLRQEGETAVRALLSAGFSQDEINFVAGDTRGHETPAVGPQKVVGAESEAGRDAFIGAVAGLVAGAIAVVLPGIGALIAAGPIAGAIGGLSAGAAAGGIVGLLREHGISEEEAQFYAEGVSRGGALVTVQEATEKRADEAREILEKNGALRTEDLAAEYATNK